MRKDLPGAKKKKKSPSEHAKSHKTHKTWKIFWNGDLRSHLNIFRHPFFGTSTDSVDVATSDAQEEVVSVFPIATHKIPPKYPAVARGLLSKLYHLEFIRQNRSFSDSVFWTHLRSHFSIHLRSKSTAEVRAHTSPF